MNFFLTIIMTLLFSTVNADNIVFKFKNPSSKYQCSFTAKISTHLKNGKIIHQDVVVRLYSNSLQKVKVQKSNIELGSIVPKKPFYTVKINNFKITDKDNNAYTYEYDYCWSKVKMSGLER
jgi:hypothetical protein